MGKTIGVVSLKGGVGKTSTVVALGAALAKLGLNVLLIDGNLSAPNLSLHLNHLIDGETLHSVLRNEANLNQAIHEYEDMHFIPADLFNKKRTNPLQLRNKIRHLKRKYDVILIDSSPALNDETLAVLMASDEVLVVTTPDHPTLSTTLKAIKIAKLRGTPISGLILNKVYGKHFEIKLKDVEDYAETPVMAIIPHDINVPKALSKLTPYTSFKPKSKGSKEYVRLAEVLSGVKGEQPTLQRWLKRTPRKPEINREVYYRSVFK